MNSRNIIDSAQRGQPAMMIFKKAIPRRTFLRGAGASLALPFLDAMIPAFAASDAAKPPLRLGYIYLPTGRIMEDWTPKTVGSDFVYLGKPDANLKIGKATPQIVRNGDITVTKTIETNSEGELWVIIGIDSGMPFEMAFSFNTIIVYFKEM